MGVYPPLQPVSVSFFPVAIVIVVNLTNKLFFFFFMARLSAMLNIDWSQSPLLLRRSRPVSSRL